MTIKKPCTHCLVKMRCKVDCEPYKKFKRIWEKGIYPGTFVLSFLMPIIYIGSTITYVGSTKGKVYLYALLSYWLVTAIATIILLKKDDESMIVHKDPFAIIFICGSIILFAWLIFVYLLEPYTDKKMKG